MVDNYINDYESATLKHIWGIVSYDDLSGNDSNLWTMNEIELLYWKETNDYSLEIETIYKFEKGNGQITYLKSLLEGFTDWMKGNNYNIDSKLCLYGVFSEGYNINSHFSTIEEVYANFKLLVNGFCSLYEM